MSDENLPPVDPDEQHLIPLEPVAPPTPKRILITGVHGFIGYSIAVALLKRGHIVLGIDKARDLRSDKSARQHNLSKFPSFEFHDCNLSNYEQTRTLLDMLSFDTVIHLAGQYSVAYNTQNLLSFIDGNLRSFLHMMDCAHSRGVKRVIYASSTFVQDGAISKSMYGATLEFRERAANVYSAMGMETIGLRFGSTYGPYIRPDVGIYQVAKKLFTGEVIDLNHDAFSYNVGFVFIADAVKVMLKLIEQEMVPVEHPEQVGRHPHHYVYYVVANDPVASIGHVLDLLEKHSGIKPKTSGRRPALERGYTPTEKLQPLQQAIGYVPGTTLEAGIEKFVEWMKKRFKAGKL